MSDAQMNAPMGAVGNFGGDNWPKASIGNYKGVMLCNRPNEFGQQKKADRAGNMPFSSMVGIHEPIGWNPTQKLLPKVGRKKHAIGVLLRHKQFLKNLETKKNEEREEQRRIVMEEEAKQQIFREIAEKQR